MMMKVISLLLRLAITSLTPLACSKNIILLSTHKHSLTSNPPTFQRLSQPSASKSTPSTTPTSSSSRWLMELNPNGGNGLIILDYDGSWMMFTPTLSQTHKVDSSPNLWNCGSIAARLGLLTYSRSSVKVGGKWGKNIAVAYATTVKGFEVAID